MEIRPVQSKDIPLESASFKHAPILRVLQNEDSMAPAAGEASKCCDCFLINAIRNIFQKLAKAICSLFCNTEDAGEVRNPVNKITPGQIEKIIRFLEQDSPSRKKYDELFKALPANARQDLRLLAKQKVAASEIAKFGEEASKEEVEAWLKNENNQIYAEKEAEAVLYHLDALTLDIYKMFLNILISAEKDEE